MITTNDTATDPDNIGLVPDLTLTKSHTGSFTQGDTSDYYTIIVTNAGTAASSGTVTVVARTSRIFIFCFMVQQYSATTHGG